MLQSFQQFCPLPVQNKSWNKNFFSKGFRKGEKVGPVYASVEDLRLYG